MAFTISPKLVWTMVWSNNSMPRLNREIWQCTHVVGSFLRRDSILRLVGGVVAGQLEE
ncbi:transposase [Corynebacterium camporealensis]